MTVVLLADLHLSENPRDEYRHRTLASVAAALDQVPKPVTTIILGDLTEAKDRHSSRLVNKVVKHVRTFAALGHVYALKGNHDYSASPDHPFFRFLTHLPGVTWVNKPKTWDMDGLGKVLWLPHTRNYKRDWEGIPLKDHRLIFAHQTFIGADMGNYIDKDGVPTKLFHPKAKIFSGDVHIGQSFDNVTYVGAPYTIDFGDVYRPRMMVYKDEEWMSAPIPGPQKLLIEYKYVPGTLPTMRTHKADIVKVRVSLKRSEVGHWAEIREAILVWTLDRKVRLHAVVPNIQQTKTPTMKVEAHRAKSDKTLMREFAADRGIDERLLKHGEKLL